MFSIDSGSWEDINILESTEFLTKLYLDPVERHRLIDISDVSISFIYFFLSECIAKKLNDCPDKLNASQRVKVHSFLLK